MADAILSAAAERLISLIDDQARYHINLVKGAEKKIHSLSVDLQNVREVLDDAENRRFKDKKVQRWLSRLELTAEEMEDVLDEWDYTLLQFQIEERVVAPHKQKVCSFIPSSSCLCFKKVAVRHNIGKKILNVKEKLDEILKERDQFGFLKSQPTDDSASSSWRESTSMVDLTEVHGRDRDRDDLVTKLMDSSGSHEESGFHVLSIVGTGGLGKTTLAQMVYNHSRVVESFELRIWVCVSNPFDQAAIAKGILESIKVGSSPNTNNLDVLCKQVQESTLGKKFFLVLDDVWNEDPNKWEILRNSLRCDRTGSKILVTSRSERVVKMMGSRESDICRPRLLTDEDCWLLLRRMALSERNEMEFEDIGKKIAEKCRGLPLAVKTLGSLLRFKSSLDQWSNVLNSEIWQMEEAEMYLFPHLLLSYNELTPKLKLCFSYCAVFPKDTKIDVGKLIQNWMALGYLGSNVGDMELKGRECFDALAKRSLFQDFDKGDPNEISSCKMHDIVHDFAESIKTKCRVEAQGMKKSTTCRVCDHLHVFKVNEFCTLKCNGEPPPNICDCLVRMRVIEFGYCGSIPKGMETLIHLRKLVLHTKLSCEDLKIIFKLYHLQILYLSNCNIEEIPKKVGNLIQLRHFDLSWNESLKELPKEIGNLIQLRHFDLRWTKSLKELPKEIGNLIQLRHFNLSRNDSLKELPKEIGNLIQLRHFDLSWINSLKELPKEIGNLIQLRDLDLGFIESLKELPTEIENLIHLRCLTIAWNKSLRELPESLCNLQELQTVDNEGCDNLCRIPERLLPKLSEFPGGVGGSKLELLKNLKHTNGVLRLRIRLNDDGDLNEVVEGAQKAELRNKLHIKRFKIRFVGKEVSSSSWVLMMDAMDALEPHPNLSELEISEYGGSKLPRWMVSPLNQLKNLSLGGCFNLTSLPSLGKLPCLEEVSLNSLKALETVGREFLGITVGEGGGNVIAFPKLKELVIRNCPNWKEWEDITVEEESAASSIMPCLTLLKIQNCKGLTLLPHRLLRNLPSLRTLYIRGSRKLEERYRDRDGSDFKSICINNPAFASSRMTDPNVLSINADAQLYRPLNVISW